VAYTDIGLDALRRTAKFWSAANWPLAARAPAAASLRRGQPELHEIRCEVGLRIVYHIFTSPQSAKAYIRHSAKLVQPVA
jgi:hypothetical protein